MNDIELVRMREEIREIKQMCAEILKRIGGTSGNVPEWMEPLNGGDNR